MRRFALLAALGPVVLGAAAVPQSPVPVGGPPPTEIVLENLDGETVQLAAARGQHAVLLVFFRGTW